ncbi:MAG: hypothetical protein JSU73_13365 [candidate division WOR-3 bacterium]|nr:MAG: hypothetical protein JSU73_13365 [candidate division WOR-3 bacterium]
MRFRILTSAVCLLASSASADPLWVRTYNGPTSLSDHSCDIEVDDSGNVLVCGLSYVDDTSTEFVTIKYRPDGDTAWVRRFDSDAFVDAATALALDRSGNVIVAGYRIASEYEDWATIKYSPDGDSLWVVFHSGGDMNRTSFIAVDSGGNSYVTGWTADWYYWFYHVVKYDSAGDFVWEYSQRTGRNGYSRAVTVDRQGYCYVTGGEPVQREPIVTCKIGLDGQEVWVSEVLEGSARAIAVDDSGNVVVAGLTHGVGGYDDYITLKIGPDGDTVWTRSYDGLCTRFDRLSDLALDAAGGVYVTGTSDVDTVHFNCVTIKYSPEGEERWVARYAGPMDFDHGLAIAVDANSDVYVTGNSLNSADTWDAVTIKYDSAGNQVWLDRYDHPGSRESASLIALGPDRSVFVGGGTQVEGHGWDCMTLKYAPVGGVVGATPQVGRYRPRPTIVRGLLMYQPTANSSQLTAGLVDITGRRVMELQPGVNDIRHVAPGVYFVREEEPRGQGVGDSSVRKVILTR